MPTPLVPTACRAACARRCGGSVCADRGDAVEQRFDARKVARMQEALRRREFAPDAEAIADRLLALGPAALGWPTN